MDITLLKTFIEVAHTGSFKAASDRLFVTQSAVSLRVQRIETTLGKALFARSKAGAELTPAGREFEKYAVSLIKLWEEARQQIAIPQGYSQSLSIGAQYSLWPRLGFRWLDALQADSPQLSIRTEMGMPDRLMRFLIEGSVQVALMYTPQFRPGLRVEKLMEDELVMVASWPDPTLDVAGRYSFVDWGPEFVHAHASALPHLTSPGLTHGLEAMVAEYMIQRQCAGYLPARYVMRYLEEGRLHLVPDAPLFPYPVYAVWRDDLDPDVTRAARSALQRVVSAVDATQGAILDELRDLSEDATLEILGQGAPPPQD
ncbi:HTH-type transcriptional regulator GltR [Aquimixticola soesokkakensis]|uniref:HTH-type transcriptional regulator GltR n=1 Tax=Aquimixticola soesokkakensis TaxID=1519096 RepID=A0A1Y5S1A5_9RHOB|nr:LysR family transcriptional regulator [Aquimixticola soesokkakensis]SLN30365.1 HTH-type transcriptional regulator GltR [Aquimixticola soesokkakensis]